MGQIFKRSLASIYQNDFIYTSFIVNSFMKVYGDDERRYQRRDLEVQRFVKLGLKLDFV